MLSPGRIGFPGFISGNESTEPEEEPPSTLAPSTRSPEAEAGNSSGGPKRKRPKFIRKVPCHVCGDVANDHIHYGAIACYSCRAFFRRGVSSSVQFFCSQSNDCKIDKTTRKHCQVNNLSNNSLKNQEGKTRKRRNEKEDKQGKFEAKTGKFEFFKLYNYRHVVSKNVLISV